ncbi:MAG TPA: hypothetical protein VEH30_01880 [Terriglobales bacterium]|nr:hypothetical protein [Terriglobales bacterium]
MTVPSQLWHGLWFAHGGLRAVLFALLVWRKTYSEFPVFFIYTGISCVQTATMIFMDYAPRVSGDEYRTAYIASTALLSALSFAVVYELLKQILRSYPTLRRVAAGLFAWATIALIAVAIAFAWFAPANGKDHYMSVVFLLRRTADLLLCGLLLLLIVFPRYLNLPWRSCTFGIVLGLGILAAAQLGAYAIRSQIQPIMRNFDEDVLEAVTQGATLCSVMVWIAYLFMPERKKLGSSKIPPKHDLELWNQELERLLQR